MKKQKTESRNQKSEIRSQTSEVRRQKSDLQSPISDLRSLTSGFRSLLLAPCSLLFRLRSPVRSLRSLLLALLFVAGLLVGVALAVEGDIVFKREGGGTPPAVFPHWFHRIRYKCYACHPAIFQMKAGADKITMDAIGQGKFCGVCHNGKTAWEVSFNTCPKCHLGQ